MWESPFPILHNPSDSIYFYFPKSISELSGAPLKDLSLLDPSSNFLNHIALSYFPWKGSHTGFACSQDCTAFTTSVVNMHIPMHYFLVSYWEPGWGAGVDEGVVPKLSSL